jgi:hypothetical protein
MILVLDLAKWGIPTFSRRLGRVAWWFGSRIEVVKDGRNFRNLDDGLFKVL